MKDKGQIFEALLHLSTNNGIVVRFAPLPVSQGRLKGNRMALKDSMEIDDINFNLAHELAHYYLHYDKGDIINSCSIEYEEQADRAAKMILDLLSLVSGKEVYNEHE